jgi:hypothetical protein
MFIHSLIIIELKQWEGEEEEEGSGRVNMIKVHYMRAWK